MIKRMIQHGLFLGLLLGVAAVQAAPVMPPAAPPVPPPAFSPAGYQFLGPINDIDGHQIIVMDTSFPLSPTVKAYSSKGKRIPLSKLRPGDTVGLKLLRINNRPLVDSIQLMEMK